MRSPTLRLILHSRWALLAARMLSYWQQFFIHYYSKRILIRHKNWDKERVHNYRKLHT